MLQRMIVDYVPTRGILRILSDGNDETIIFLHLKYSMPEFILGRKFGENVLGVASFEEKFVRVAIHGSACISWP